MNGQSQKEAVLNALKSGPKTTWQLGYGLNICCVTKRISELRSEGYEIIATEKRILGKGPGKRIVTYSLAGQLSLRLEDVA